MGRAAIAAYWQLEKMPKLVTPYLRSSKAAAESGDLARANEILFDATTKFPDNNVLAEAYCRLALKTKRWGDAVQRWELIEDGKLPVSSRLQVSVVEAFVQIGNLEKAYALLEEQVAVAPHDQELLRVEALLAEAKKDWLTAAEKWLARGGATKGRARVNSYVGGVRALINAGALDRAEEEAQILVKKFPKQVAFFKLHAEVAIASDAWVIALERWKNLEVHHSGKAGTMPPEWVFKIGVDEARERTSAISIDRLRATGMLSIATTIQSADEVGALRLGRQAKKFYSENVELMTAEVLFANSRHSAAIWWTRRLIATSEQPKKHYPLLIEALIKSSRLDECEDALAVYEAKYGKNSVWFRGMVEIHYRRDDFSAMREVMQLAVTNKLPISSDRTPVMRWLYDLVYYHPTPASFLPADIHSLVLRTTTLYDGKFLSDALGLMFDPARGDAAVDRYKQMIAQNASSGLEIDPVQREEILRFFIRRREWEQVQALLDLPLTLELDAKSAKKIWNVVRSNIDTRLGDADVVGAEALAVTFLDQLSEAQLDSYAMSLTHMLLARLPTSKAVSSRLLETTQRLGYAHMGERISDWQQRYVGFDTSSVVNIAERKRCFIVGNGPSISQMPLDALTDEDVFCVNRGMRALDIGLPHPKYLVVADPLVYKNHAREIDADGASVERFFLATNCLWRKPPTVPVIPLGCSSKKLSLTPFRHAPLHLHRGNSVVVMAAQIAHLMGYKEIYIIGVDLDYSGSATHFYGGGNKETERLDNFRPGGSGPELVNLSFANLQEVLAEDDCRLYNAAPGGKLDMIERVDFYDVLGMPKPYTADEKNAVA